MVGPGVPEAEKLLLRAELDTAAAERVSDAITKVAPTPAELAQVSVSRLVNPGRAYYELVHPIPEDLAAHQKRLAGSGAHDLLERALAAGVELTEIWLNGEEAPGEPGLEHITARVDACERTEDGRLLPTEIKNVGTEKDRPAEEHLEQLGMYCALLGVDQGRVLAVLRDDTSGSSRLLVPWKVTFPDVAMVRKVMADRRDRLTEAFAQRDPSRLPACPWWSMGCKYREAGLCDCGSRPPLDPAIAHSAHFERDPDYLATLQSRAAEREKEAKERKSPGNAPPALTLYGFLTPRKLFFASREPPSGGEEEGEAAAAASRPAATPAATDSREQADRALARVNVRGVERQLFSAILRSSGGRAGFTSVERGSGAWRLPVLDGKPFLVRVRHVGRALDGSARELAGNWGVPEDLRQLAVRASLLGVEEGWVYVWNWKLTDPRTKLQVFGVRFDPASLLEVRTQVEGLQGRLEAALASGDHRTLPLCPRWMCTKCTYLTDCQPDQG